jgi:hypothetical protein
MPNQPTAKKLLKTKRKTAATMPVVVLVCEVAPARTAIDICARVSMNDGASKRCKMAESYSLASRAKQHEFSSSKLLDGKDGDEGREEVFGTVQCCKKTAEKSGETDAVLKNGGCVVLWQQKSASCLDGRI